MMQTVGARGMKMPKLGLGTWKLRGDEGRESVARAIALGYRHIDTATVYDNEAAVGAGIAASGVRRGEIFLTTKVWHEDLASDAIARSIRTSLGKLKSDYVDLFLIHWPSPGMDLPAAMEAMARVKSEGLARNIGVSNFTVSLLRQAVGAIGDDVACNQIEYHLLLDQSPVLAYARGRGIVTTAYCPLAQGRLGDHQALAGLAAKHHASTAQIALKYLLDQDGVAAIPKAAREASQRSNLAALDIDLDDEDRREILALPKDQRFVDPDFAPTWDVAASPD